MNILKKINFYGSYDFAFTSEKFSLFIYFGGNGDLYWLIKNANSNENFSRFIVSKDEYFIYNIFLNLYSDILNANVFKNNNLSSVCDCEKLNLNLKNSYEYKLLCNDNIITWHSDEEVYEKSNILKIRKLEDSFIIDIEYGNSIYNLKSIRFRNSGSYYYPFNIIFMRMYNELQLYDFNYQQICIDEYLYNKNKLLKKK